MTKSWNVSSSVQVRLVGVDEHAELRDVRLAALAYSDHLLEHLKRESDAPVGFWRDRAKRGATGVTMATFVAVGEDGFEGIVDGLLSEEGATLEVAGMWVNPSLRCSGIGRALLGAVCEWGRERGAQRAALWVRSENGPARRLYAQDGFALADTALRLERSL